MLDSAFSDTTGAWLLNDDGSWLRAEAKENKAHTHQSAMIRRAQSRAPARALIAVRRPDEDPWRAGRRRGRRVEHCPSTRRRRRSTGVVGRGREAREHLGLGAEIATCGALSRPTVALVAELCAGYARRARRLGSERGEAIVTAPGRQGRAPGELAAALGPGDHAARARSLRRGGRATRIRRRGLARQDRPGRRRWPSSTSVVARPRSSSAPVRVAEPGCIRSTSGRCGSRRALLAADPPSRREVKAARKLVRAALAGVEPPPAGRALAAGGTARAVAKLVGRTFAADDLDEVVATLRRRPSAEVGSQGGDPPVRAGTVLAGAFLLAETARLLDQHFELARGGLREGAALALGSVGSARGGRRRNVAGPAWPGPLSQAGRTSGLYVIRCGSSASGPRVSRTQSSYSPNAPSNHVTCESLSKARI